MRAGFFSVSRCTRLDCSPLTICNPCMFAVVIACGLCEIERLIFLVSDEGAIDVYFQFVKVFLRSTDELRYFCQIEISLCIFGKIDDSTRREIIVWLLEWLGLITTDMCRNHGGAMLV